MVSGVLMPQTLGLLDPAGKVVAISVINSIAAVVGLVSNVLFGGLSDRTRSRFGRRKPWVVGGSLLAAASFVLMGMASDVMGVGLLFCSYIVGLNMMLAPEAAPLADRIPERLRGTMSALSAGGGALGSGLGAALGACFIDSVAQGFAIAGAITLFAALFTVAVWPADESTADVPPDGSGLVSLVRSFAPPRDAPDFWRAFGGRMALFLGYTMITGYQLYLLQDYVGLGLAESAAVIGLMGATSVVSSTVAGLVGGPVSDRLGRRRAPVVVSVLLVCAGLACAWLMRSVVGMVALALIGGFGYGMFGSVDGALNVDVLPRGGEVGKDLGIINISTSTGQAIAPLLTSTIVAVTGGYGAAFPVAIAACMGGCAFIMSIKGVS
jgi:MFS family permease